MWESANFDSIMSVFHARIAFKTRMSSGEAGARIKEPKPDGCGHMRILLSFLSFKCGRYPLMTLHGTRQYCETANEGRGQLGRQARGH